MNDDTRDLAELARAAGYVFPAGWTVTASLEADYDSTPHDGDWATPQDIAAWKNGKWRYVGVVVTVRDGEGREWGTASLRGVEHGLALDDGTTTDALARDDVLPELVTEACVEATSAATGWVAEWWTHDLTVLTDTELALMVTTQERKIEDAFMQNLGRNVQDEIAPRLEIVARVRAEQSRRKGSSQ
jgi:hypothetical protein